MSRNSELNLKPYHLLPKSQWAELRHGEPMTLDFADLERLHSLNDPISLVEAEQVYLPLTRLLSFYVEAIQGLHHASSRFLGNTDAKVPFIIGVAGSVAVGKSTTARVLRALLRRWPSSPKVDLITTDGFLYSNDYLGQRGLMARKGFPESYDRGRFVRFLADIKSGHPEVSVPVYSHLIYDIQPDAEIIIDRPDILIVEGLNILQPGELPGNGKPILFASDFLDFSIYIDATEPHLRKWFIERFQRLRHTAFKDPSSYFHQFTQMTEEEAVAFGTDVWEAINLPNLMENILPTRGRADLILTKSEDHTIESVALRRV